MKAVVCEMCGSQELVKEDGMYVCQSCGTKYSTEEAKKLMVEVSGSVTVDNSKKLENYYQLARQAKDSDNSKDAAKYYDLIRQEVPSDWEANFYSVYYVSISCIVANIPTASAALANCIDNVVKQIKEGIETEEEQLKALTEITKKCQSATLMFYGAIWKQYQPNGYYNNPAYFAPKTTAALSILTNLGNAAEKHLGLTPTFSSAIAEIRKCDILTRTNQITSYYYSAADHELINKLAEKVKEIDPSYEAPIINPPKSGGCYVATAVYGSYDCPEVWTLRRFRDYTLAETWYGRAFIHTYYAISPTLVKWFGKTEWFKNMWKPTLDKMVKKLNEKGVEDTKYNDREW